MRFFNLDCHVSVIEDIKKIFEDLGHEVVSWSISGHNWVFNRFPTNVEIVNSKTWMNLNDEMANDFYEKYKDFLSQFDGFICTYPPSFSLLFERLKKPIILQVPIRYEIPFHSDATKWERFNEKLRTGIDNNLIFPIANSQYDKDYFEFFVNRNCDLIPNICSYTNTKWNPTFDKFLYTGRLPITSDLIISKNQLGRYTWETVSQFKGIIIIPYNCSTMSIFEHYTANIPLFCPSLDLMMSLYKEHKTSVLSEITWNQTFNLPQGSIISCDSSNDPNMFLDIEIMKNWIAKSDFYNKEWMPHIVYFDSFEDLGKKLFSTDLYDVSSSMKRFNEIRKRRIYNLWLEKLNKIS